MLLLGVLLLLPAHWFWHFSPAWTYWSGIQMEPWIPKVFGSSLLVLLLWGVSLFHFFRVFWRDRTRGGSAASPQFRLFANESSQRLLIAAILGAVAVVGSTTFSLVRPAAVSFWLQTLLGPVALLVWLGWQRANLSWTWVWSGLVGGVVLQAALAWWQYWFQRSLGGYWLLGQPDVRLSSAVKSMISSEVFALPVGSTPHPNVLAAWLVLGLLILWRGLPTLQGWLRIALSVFLLFPLAWTESWAAWATLVVLVILLQRNRWAQLSDRLKRGVIGLLWISALGVVLVLPSVLPALQKNPSWHRRATMLQAAPRLLAERPQGWGPVQHPLGYSPAEQVSLRTLSRQPIHSAGIGVVTDLSVWILFLLSAFLIVVQRKYSTFVTVLLISLPLFSLDHFGYSTISGQFLVVVYFIFLHSQLNAC